MARSIDQRYRHHSCLRVSRTCQEMEVSAEAPAAPSVTVTLHSRYQPKPYKLPVLLI